MARKKTSLAQPYPSSPDKIQTVGTTPVDALLTAIDETPSDIDELSNDDDETMSIASEESEHWPAPICDKHSHRSVDVVEALVQSLFGKSQQDPATEEEWEEWEAFWRAWLQKWTIDQNEKLSMVSQTGPGQ